MCISGWHSGTSCGIIRSTITRDCAINNVRYNLPSSRTPPLQRRPPLMVVPLDSVQVPYDPPTEYPDNEQDKPIDGLALVSHKSHDLDRCYPANPVV